MAHLVDIRYDQYGSTTPGGSSTPISTSGTAPTRVATVRFPQICGANLIELDGIIHVNNDNTNVTSTQYVTVEIRRGALLIYQANIEIDGEAVDDYTFVTFKHIDPLLSRCMDNVEYTLSIHANVSNMFFHTPVNFTAKRYLIDNNVGQ
ncbi:hypothetical protein [Thermoactinomyces sp. DSM 45892]|uniref:hypothetical protein n=1 Tax=Thermoactinomyces sp. DSM 45892 TaxID=1882753 RepID=UPI00089D4B00|nr:hypothetical protein [Thermoactinomyces sp. DSM 45892]SDY93131.1 hypothetical protein SAMN05444416_11055 [Thermoactinomyces sp. DSM 45892]